VDALAAVTRVAAMSDAAAAAAADGDGDDGGDVFLGLTHL